jgi:hypothetical protein
MSFTTGYLPGFAPIVPPIEEVIFERREANPGPDVVYLASPYSHADPAIMEWRHRATVRAAAHLMQRGDVVFSPIAHSHEVGKHLGKQVGGAADPDTHAFWMSQDLPMLRRATRMVVLMLPGWSTSRGVKEEIEFAENHGLGISFVNPVDVGVEHPWAFESAPTETQTFGPLDDVKASNPKDSIGATKLPLSLVPETAIAHASLAHLDGAAKYGAWNWRHAGVRASIYLDAVRRHLAAWQAGEERAADSGVHHLGHALACVNILLDAQACGKLIDDRPPSVDLTTFYATLTPEVARIKARHSDKHPHHYTIKDTTL